MEVFKSFLATEILASVLMIGSLAIVVRSYMVYAKDAGELSPRLEKIEKELEKRLKKLEPKRKTVGALSKLVLPVREKEQKYLTYYTELRESELEAEKATVENAEEQEAEKRRRLQRKRMGFGSGEGEEEGAIE